MRATGVILSAIVGLSATAHAAPIVMRDAPAAAALPSVAASERACGPTASVTIGRRAKIAGRSVEVLHDCADTAMSHLAIAAGDAWIVVDGFTIHDPPSHMTVTPTQIALADEVVVAGTFADGAPAIVYRSAARWTTSTSCAESDAACRTQVLSIEVRADVLVCTTGDAVRCGRVASYTCPAAGCGRPDFKAGVLRTVEAGSYAVAP